MSLSTGAFSVVDRILFINKQHPAKLPGGPVGPLGRFVGGVNRT